MAIEKTRTKRNICISMDLYRVLQPFVMVTRAFGFLPIVFQRQGCGYVVQFSHFYGNYSYILAVSTMILSMKGLCDDFRSVDSIRMKNSVVKYIALLDLGEIIVTVFIGILVTPTRLRHFWKLLESLEKIDKVQPQKLVENERKRITLAMIVGIACVVSVLTYEMYLWGTISHKNGLLWVFTKRYLVLFCTYFMVFVQEMPYWKFVRMIRRRIETLNEALGYNLELFQRFTTLWITPIKSRERKSTTVLTSKNVLDFMKIYELVGDAVDACNDFCAVSILLIMLSCLLHLVVIPYFLLVELANKGHLVFLFLQVSWTVLHFGRLMVIVETCQDCLDEYQKTIDLAFKLLACDLPEEVKELLKLFALQLSGRKVIFTAFSMMKINRPLLTAIGGSITTFLVVLFQFGSVGKVFYYSTN